MNLDGIRVGTSSFTAAGWETSFYPNGMKPADYLAYYATKFDTVEVDSTYYRTPAVSTVEGWRGKTPEGFIFALKVPRAITRDKILVDCQTEFETFMRTADHLGDAKLGPMLLQFPYFNKAAFKSGEEFLARLEPFLKLLPRGRQFAVEIRNKNWLNADFANLLQDHNVALALIDQSWVPRPWEMLEPFDLITSDFTYVRWLGDRKAIEEKTNTWDKTIVDRHGDMSEWVKILRNVHKRKIQIFAYANNHYAGHGPATAELFRSMWSATSFGSL